MGNGYDNKSHRDLFDENRRISQQLCDALRAAGLGQAHRVLLADAQAVGMATWRRRAAFQVAAPELVLDMRMVGYVTFGELGNLVTMDDPGLAGLRDACEIFRLGTIVGSVFTASRFVGQVSRPGQALRNRLAAAAGFVDTYCQALARAMRSPQIEVTNAGLITHNAHLGPRVHLQAP